MGLQPEGTARAKEQYLIPLALPDIGALLESFADPVLLIDAEIYRVLGWNRRVLEQYGFRPDQPLRRPLLDLFARESRLELKSWLRASAPGGLDVHGALRNGGKQRFRLTAHRMNHYQGSVFLLFLALDSSHRRPDHEVEKKDTSGNERAEIAASLRESEARFQTLAETTPAAVFIHRGQRLVFANRAAEKMTGYSREEMYVGEFWRELNGTKPTTEARRHGENQSQKLTTEATELHQGLLENVEDLRGNKKVSGQAIQSGNLCSEDLQSRRYQVKFLSKFGEPRA